MFVHRKEASSRRNLIRCIVNECLRDPSRLVNLMSRWPKILTVTPFFSWLPTSSNALGFGSRSSCQIRYQRPKTKDKIRTAVLSVCVCWSAAVLCPKIRNRVPVLFVQKLTMSGLALPVKLRHSYGLGYGDWYWNKLLLDFSRSFALGSKYA